jgi:hypothetical protein
VPKLRPPRRVLGRSGGSLRGSDPFAKPIQKGREGEIWPSPQNNRKRDIVDSKSTHECDLSDLAAKTCPFLLHEG